MENVLESEYKILQAKGGRDQDSITRQALLKDVEPSRSLEIVGESMPWWRRGEDWGNKVNEVDETTGKGNGKEREGRGMDELGVAEMEAIGAMVKMEGDA